MQHTIILASKSPRRIEILRRHGVNAFVRKTDADETLPEGISPRDAVMALSLPKAQACLANLRKYGEITADGRFFPREAGCEAGMELQNCAFEGFLILASDTVVYKDGIMGKPRDRAEAVSMLTRLRGTSHEVMTGGALIDPVSGRKRVFCDVTRVFCKAYSQEEMEHYIDTEKPYDKAGAYAIQEGFGKFVDHIEGDIETVIGLPFARVKAEIEALDRG